MAESGLTQSGDKILGPDDLAQVDSSPSNALVERFTDLLKSGELRKFRDQKSLFQEIIDFAFDVEPGQDPISLDVLLKAIQFMPSLIEAAQASFLFKYKGNFVCLRAEDAADNIRELYRKRGLQNKMRETAVCGYLVESLNKAVAPSGMKHLNEAYLIDSLMISVFSEALKRPIGVDQLVRSLNLIFEYNSSYENKLKNFVQYDRLKFLEKVVKNYAVELKKYGVKKYMREVLNIKLYAKNTTEIGNDDSVSKYGQSNLNNGAIELAKVLDDGATLGMTKDFVAGIVDYLKQMSDREEHNREAASAAEGHYVSISSKLEALFKQIVELIYDMTSKASQSQTPKLIAAVEAATTTSLSTIDKLPVIISLLSDVLELDYDQEEDEDEDLVGNVRYLNFREARDAASNSTRVALIDVFAPYHPTDLVRNGNSHYKNNLSFNWSVRGFVTHLGGGSGKERRGSRLNPSGARNVGTSRGPSGLPRNSSLVKLPGNPSSRTIMQEFGLLPSSSKNKNRRAKQKGKRHRKGTRPQDTRRG